MGLGLGAWQGDYQEASGLWLRWYDANQQWIPTAAERAEQEKQRADKLAVRLRELGVDPDRL
ncbi:MAG: hypothetical protein F6J97_10905 [Leptolyngbya sp. SIO4C1]|nr:hypothetical protein [Leptolyngbya sp. SIO4C1]